MKNSLIQKYNIPGPRYTSHPTVPFWDENSFSYQNWTHLNNYEVNKYNCDRNIYKSGGSLIFCYLFFLVNSKNVNGFISN